MKIRKEKLKENEEGSYECVFPCAACGSQIELKVDVDTSESDRRQRFLENTLDEIASDFPVVLHGGEASGKSDSIANILNLLECYRLSKQEETG